MQYYRSIFVSDVHLGSRGAQADALRRFLLNHRCDNLYLVGDIIDIWSMRRQMYFPRSHMEVVQQFLDIANKGTRVVYIPGNHDEDVRNFIPINIGSIEIIDETVHLAADGRRYLVVHGDCYDQVVQHARWLAVVGDISYSLLLRSNAIVNKIRQRFGYNYWSLSAYVKARVKSAVNFIGDFEEAVIESARVRGVDGVICGHIHTAAMRDMHGVAYLNDGDWVESCTALVEHHNGRFEIVHWCPHSTVVALPKAA